MRLQWTVDGLTAGSDTSLRQVFARLSISWEHYFQILFICCKKYFFLGLTLLVLSFTCSVLSNFFKALDTTQRNTKFSALLE